ncbi:MAG: 16S rRNA (adenine(1518)-N(6)/adenine(1519)-N(6))-dimethyltransferase RsmA [Halobacteriaceae archaeon]
MTSPRDPDALITRAGHGSPEFDQHFLVDDRVLDRIPSYLSSYDLSNVLEIGGGTGALTDRLLQVADHVNTIEQDPQLVSFLEDEFATAIADDRLTVIQGDAVTVELPSFSACIANLPYSAASEILFRLLPKKKPLLLMFQREFAERMVATPESGDYGRLSVTAQYYADIDIVETIPPEAFDPQPPVESALVRLIPRASELEIHEDFFLRFVKAIFTQRRKTLRNGIRNTTHISGIRDPKAVIETINDELLQRRPDSIPPETFANLAKLAYSHGEVDVNGS